MQVDATDEVLDDITIDPVIPSKADDEDDVFGPWLKTRSRRGSFWGRGGSRGGSRGGNRLPATNDDRSEKTLDPDAWPLAWQSPLHVVDSSPMHRTRGGHAGGGGHSLLSKRASLKPFSSSENAPPVGSNPSPLPENSPPISCSDTHPPTLSSPLPLIPTTGIDARAFLGCTSEPSTGFAFPLPKSNDSSASPILISSLIRPSDGDSDIGDQHLLTVDKVVTALSTDHHMDDSLSEISESSEEHDEDMGSPNNQNEAKMEALARRDTSKSGTRPKKGRKSPIT